MSAEHQSVTLDPLVVALDQEIGVLSVSSADVELLDHVVKVRGGPAEGGHDLDRDVVVGLTRHRAVGGMVKEFQMVELGLDWRWS